MLIVLADIFFKFVTKVTDIVRPIWVIANLKGTPETYEIVGV